MPFKLLLFCCITMGVSLTMGIKSLTDLIKNKKYSFFDFFISSIMFGGFFFLLLSMFVLKNI